LKPHVERPQPSAEHATPERCRILESWNVASDPDVSIARARVAPGVTTRLHRLAGVTERYLVVEGSGRVAVGSDILQDIAPGDVVIIPPGVTQQVTNIGAGDLLFYCICTPRFTPACYEALD
jgi:mannose-6-phosphate isomerase-like protein (cupin superfamily)